jgi:hypothetical protein
MNFFFFIMTPFENDTISISNDVNDTHEQDHSKCLTKRERAYSDKGYS